MSFVAFYWSRLASQKLETMTTDQQEAGGDFRRLTRVKSCLISSGVADSQGVFQSDIVIVHLIKRSGFPLSALSSNGSC